MSEIAACTNSDSTQNNEVEKIENDPYAYLDKNGFSSEKFKIEVRNLPRFYGIAELKKLINEKLKLASNKIKVPKKQSSWLFVCFRCEEDKQEALKAINGYVWKNNVLKAETAKAAPDPLVKRRNEDREFSHAEKKPRIDPNLSQEEVLKQNATPLWQTPYLQQLQEKTEMVRDQLKKYTNELSVANRNLKPWINEQREKYNGLPCELREIVAAPEKCDGYRNKCEFTIGTNPETKERTIGFRLGSYAAGTIGVGPIQNLNNICDRMKNAVQVFEKFIRASDLDVFNPETHSGSWRQLTVRHGVATDELMLIVFLHPQQMNKEQLESVRNDLKTFFESGEGKELNITSLYTQIMQKKLPGEEPAKPEHLLGRKHIIEKLCGLEFKITPEIFFQVNTSVAELLFDCVRNLANLDKKTTLIDVCCGTGTIGLCLANDCGQVLGLELQEEAIQLAKENAELNRIENCSFFAGKAEEILSAVIWKATSPSIIGVVDPPRAGLQQKGIVFLRKSRIKKLVYLACNIKAALKNIVDLGRPQSKTLFGDPFVITSVIPVDMFPHTIHCELVLCLERIDPATNLLHPAMNPSFEGAVEDESLNVKNEKSMDCDSSQPDDSCISTK